MKTNKLSLISFVSFCLCACGSNGNINKKQVFINEDFFVTKGDFSIGLNETKVIPIDFKVLDTIAHDDNDYLRKNVSISLVSCIETSNYIMCEIFHPQSVIDATVGACDNAISFYCTSKFDGPIDVEQIIFETDKTLYTFETDLTILFNEEYTNYPPFAPSADVEMSGGYTASPYLGNWNTKNVFGKYITLNLEWYYDLKLTNIAINDITFSANLTPYINKISLLFISKNLNWQRDIGEMIVHDSFENNSFIFEDIRSVNYNLECGETSAIIYRVNFKNIKGDSWCVCGDINYNVSLNGEDYVIKDIFYIW